MKVIRMNALKDFSRSALLAAGMSEPDAETVAKVLLTIDTFGVRSHGLNNLYAYVQKMRTGRLDPAAVPAVLAEGPAWALLDGNSAIGMVSSCKGMDLAIEKARQTGIGYVGVRNSCHFGAAGY